MRSDIDLAARAALDEITDKIAAGISARQAVSEAFDKFRGKLMSKLRNALSKILGYVPDISVMEIGRVTLSERLYRMEEETAINVERILKRHVREVRSARETSLAIYEGYKLGGVLDVKVNLPRYIRQIKPLAKEYENAFAKLTAGKLKTPHLRAAYIQAIDAIERGTASSVLKTKLDVAVHERNRYLADRITQTELHRARMQEKAKKMKDDIAVQWVQVRMSQTHPRTDICDYHSGLDAYGLGRGVYSKNAAPLPPFHPFCRCILVPRVDLYGAKADFDSNAERRYIEALDKQEGARVLGSRAKYNAAVSGGSVVGAYYGDAPPKLVGEV